MGKGAPIFSILRRQSMKTPLLSHKRRLFIGPLVILVFSLVLSACEQSSGNGNRSSTVATKPPVATATVSGILLGPQPCPAAIQAAAHWNVIVGTNAMKTVQGVVCGYLMGVPTLQAVVKVRGSLAPFLLDIDVYTTITSTKPMRIFALTGLLQGDVSISNYNTLLNGAG